MIEQIPQLIYMATPTLLGTDPEFVKKQMDFVSSEGNAPLHPFPAMPYEYYEGGIVGRERTLELCLRFVEISDVFYLFGVSKGTLIEFKHALKIGKRFKLLMDDWDPNWISEYKRLGERIPILDLVVASKNLKL